MDHIIERMRRAPCDEIRIVTRPDKVDVIQRADRLGAQIILGQPATIAGSLLQGIDHLDPEDAVLLGFPDTIWEPIDGFAQLLPLIEQVGEVALGLFRMDEPHRSDVVEFDESGRVLSIQVRPKNPASNWIWGCFAARRDSLAGLVPDLELGTYFDRLSHNQGVVYAHLSDVFLDIGTPEAMRLYERLPYREVVDLARQRLSKRD